MVQRPTALQSAVQPLSHGSPEPGQFCAPRSQSSLGGPPTVGESVSLIPSPQQPSPCIGISGVGWIGQSAAVVHAVPFCVQRPTGSVVVVVVEETVDVDVEGTVVSVLVVVVLVVLAAVEVVEVLVNGTVLVVLDAVVDVLVEGTVLVVPIVVEVVLAVLVVTGAVVVVAVAVVVGAVLVVVVVEVVVDAPPGGSPLALMRPVAIWPAAKLPVSFAASPTCSSASGAQNVAVTSASPARKARAPLERMSSAVGSSPVVGATTDPEPIRMSPATNRLVEASARTIAPGCVRRLQNTYDPPPRTSTPWREAAPCTSTSA